MLIGVSDDLKINEKIISAFEMFENSNQKISLNKFYIILSVLIFKIVYKFGNELRENWKKYENNFKIKLGKYILN